MRFLSDERVVDTTSEKKRTVQVIAAGLPRCATSSMQQALESSWLGFGPSMHMAHVMPNLEVAQLVEAAILEQDKATRQKLLYQLFDGYAATCDYPGVCFIEDLMDMFPDAAIVLNQRDSPAAWSRSFRDSIGFFGSVWYRAICCLWATDRQHVAMQRATNIYFTRTLGRTWSMGRPSSGDPAADEAADVEWYNDYNDMVRNAAKARGRPVLEWKPSDGWRPLCKFLGKPAPPANVPFPRVNDQKAMRTLKIIIVTRGLVSWAAVGGAVYLTAKYGPRLLGFGRV